MKTATHEADREAMRIAARQWGVLSHAQAIKAGLTVDQITYRLRSGQWRRVATGVYVVAGAPDRWEQKVMIACLAGPAGTVASHLTAAALFGLSKAPAVPQVTINRGASGRFQSARPFRGQLAPGETCIRNRIRCTTPTRTIIDCAAAALVDSEGLCDLVDSALCKKLVQPSRLLAASGRAWAAATGRRRGRLAALERALDVWRSGAPAGSPPEARLQRRLIEWGFPRAERQVEVYDEDGTFVARADVGIRELRVLFEAARTSARSPSPATTATSTTVRGAGSPTTSGSAGWKRSGGRWSPSTGSTSARPVRDSGTSSNASDGRAQR